MKEAHEITDERQKDASEVIWAGTADIAIQTVSRTLKYVLISGINKSQLKFKENVRLWSHSSSLYWYDYQKG